MLRYVLSLSFQFSPSPARAHHFHLVFYREAKAAVETDLDVGDDVGEVCYFVRYFLLPGALALLEESSSAAALPFSLLDDEPLHASRRRPGASRIETKNWRRKK